MHAAQRLHGSVLRQLDPRYRWSAFLACPNATKEGEGVRRLKRKSRMITPKVDVSVTEDRPHWRGVPIEKERLGDDAAPTADAQKSRIIHNPPGKLQRNKYSAAR